jgi:hypothetical protein
MILNAVSRYILPLLSTLIFPTAIAVVHSPTVGCGYSTAHHRTGAYHQAHDTRTMLRIEATFRTHRETKALHVTPRGTMP